MQMITNNPFKCIDLPYSEILNLFVLKAFADHNSNAAQIIGFGIHKLKYKILWDEEKILVSSNFVLLHIDFKSLYRFH